MTPAKALYPGTKVPVLTWSLLKLSPGHWQQSGPLPKMGR